MGPLSQLAERQFETLAGFAIVTSGLVALRRPPAWVVAVALVAGGATWIAPVISGGGVSSLFIHRALLAVALIATSMPTWHWRLALALLLAFVVVCAVPKFATTPWVNGATWLTVITGILLLAWPSPRRSRLLPALAAFAVMWVVAVIGVEIQWFSSDARRLVYHVAAGATAILAARAARSPITPEVVLDVSPDSLWAVGVRSLGEDCFVGIDGRPLTASGAHRVEFELDALGTALLVHNDPAFEDPRLREPLRHVVRILAERIAVRRRIDAQAAEVEESRQRVLAADREASRAMRRDVAREVQPHLDAIDRLLAEAGVTDGQTTKLLGEVRSEIEALIAGAPPGLLADGIGPAMHALASRSSVPASIRVDDLELDEGLARSLFLVASEAVANVAKHSHAHRLTIELVGDGAAVVLRVSDDGRGGATLPDGGGLAEARRRVVSLGGTFDVNSRNGTVLTVRLPAPA